MLFRAMLLDGGGTWQELGCGVVGQEGIVGGAWRERCLYDLRRKAVRMARLAGCVESPLIC
jgi:hypothetical protein